MVDGDGLPFLGQVARIDQVDARRDLEAAGAADRDEALDLGNRKPLDQRPGRLGDRSADASR